MYLYLAQRWWDGKSGKNYRNPHVTRMILFSGAFDVPTGIVLH